MCVCVFLSQFFSNKHSDDIHVWIQSKIIYETGVYPSHVSLILKNSWHISMSLLCSIVSVLARMKSQEQSTGL